MFARLIIVVLGVLLPWPSAANAAPVDGITITTRAIEELDDNRFFTRVGGTLLGTTDYTGLTPGESYTVSSQLVDRDTGTLVGENVFQAFVPETPTGIQTVELPIEPNRTASNIYLALVQVLYGGEVTAGSAGSAVVLAEQTDIDNVDQTVEVHAVQAISVTAVDAADGDNSLPAAGGTVVATVNHVNLVAGYKYTVGGQMLTPSGQATGVYANVPLYEPVDKDGTLTLEFDVPARFEGLRLVPSVGLYHQNRVVINASGGVDWLVDAPQPVMIASDPALADPAKTIEVGTPFDAAASPADTAGTDSESSGMDAKWVWLGVGVLVGALAALGVVRLMSSR